MVIAAGTGSSRAIAGVARQIDKLQYRAVRIMKIGAWAVEYAALPVLLEGDLDAMSAQMLKCSRVLVVCNREGMMHTAMVVGHGVDRRVTRYQELARVRPMRGKRWSLGGGEKRPPPTGPP